MTPLPDIKVAELEEAVMGWTKKFGNADLWAFVKPYMAELTWKKGPKVVH